MIGNDSYPSGPLRNARNDAEAMAQRLGELGFQVELQLDATREVMKRAISSFRERRSEVGGLGLFYYAGHGIQVEGANYLIPIDAEIEDEQGVEFQAVSAEEVLSTMATGGGASIAILDACRNNPFRSLGRTIKRGLALMNAPNGMLIAYATAPGKTAIDGQSSDARSLDGTKGTPSKGERPNGHGVFTGALLNHIASEGLTVEQMLKKTSAEVRKATSGKQTPWIAFDWPDDVYLKPGASAQAEDLLTLAASNIQVRDYLSVVRDLSRLLAEGRIALTDAQKSRAQQLRETAAQRLAELELHVEPRDAMLRVDGTLYLSNAGKLCLNPGPHTVAISEDGYRPMVRSVKLEEQSVQVLRAVLRDEANHEVRPKLAWSLGAVGGAALVVSLATVLRSAKIDRRLDQVCGGPSCPEDSSYDWARQQQKGRRLQLTSSVMLGTGVVALAGGTMVHLWPRWFNSERANASTPIARVDCSGRGCFAEAAISF